MLSDKAIEILKRIHDEGLVIQWSYCVPTARYWDVSTVDDLQWKILIDEWLDLGQPMPNEEWTVFKSEIRPEKTETIVYESHGFVDRFTAKGDDETYVKAIKIDMPENYEFDSGLIYRHVLTDEALELLAQRGM